VPGFGLTFDRFGLLGSLGMRPDRAYSGLARHIVKSHNLNVKHGEGRVIPQEGCWVERWFAQIGQIMAIFVQK